MLLKLTLMVELGVLLYCTVTDLLLPGVPLGNASFLHWVTNLIIWCIFGHVWMGQLRFML